MQRKERVKARAHSSMVPLTQTDVLIAQIKVPDAVASSWISPSLG
jgi:hypothetical protein